MRIVKVTVDFIGSLPERQTGFVAVIAVEMEGSIGRIVLHGVKIIRGRDERLSVMMPSEMVARPCGSCDGRVPILAQVCPWCGSKNPHRPAGVDRSKGVYYTDTFHPANQETRMRFEAAVLQAYDDALKARSGIQAGGPLDNGGGHASAVEEDGRENLHR